ncbi:MAG: hypothetical protein OK454_09980, partial [Thaumarchaeota archaeon]|nr:hypothetical protein [Nitrososphaerota archaeon]
MICHNAQVYNRPSAPIFGEAIQLREVFVKELKTLAGRGAVTAEEAELPDLGELPPVEDSPPPDEEDEDEEDEDEDEEDEEEDDDDSDDEGGIRRRGRGRRSSMRGKRDLDDEDSHKKRGRPPKVFTPLEARIHQLIKGLRKFKNEEGGLRVLAFEKTVDKASNPGYYDVIQNPIALDAIKKRAKRKKYRSVDEVLADLELMFENAKAYNEEGSDIYDDAVELQ